MMFVITGFGENPYGEKNHGVILEVSRSFGKNAIKENEEEI